MSVRIEKLIAEYPDMVRDRKCLAYQIAHFRGLSAEEVIESMYTLRQDGERVQTSSLSDKTAQIAMSYRERLNRMNREWYEHLEWRLRCVSDELDFFESAIRALSGELSSVMVCLVLDGMTWDATADALHMSRANIGKLRKKAILELDMLYARHDLETTAYMLGTEGWYVLQRGCLLRGSGSADRQLPVRPSPGAGGQQRYRQCSCARHYRRAHYVKAQGHVYADPCAAAQAGGDGAEAHQRCTG